MYLARLELLDFRCYESVALELPAAVIGVTGANGQGKTSLLEAMGWLALGHSFRRVPDGALIRDGAERAVIRGVVGNGSGTRSVDVELRQVGRHRILLNGHPAARTRDLLGSLRVTVFAPDDLQLVKGGPGERRGFLDELLAASAPRYAGVRGDVERVLRHRNALLRAGVRDREARATLAVFDDQLVQAGGELVRGRLRLLARLAPAVDAAYRALAPHTLHVRTAYHPGWADPDPPVDQVEAALRAALERERRRELDRGVTLVGPHRDDCRLTIDERDSRTHASQGEQRTLALALRLASHRVVAEVVGSEPVLLLDDVFSELDGERAAALVAALPSGAQTVVTTAGTLPAGITPACHLEVGAGRVTGAQPSL
ncbi:MAG TPA: DNA replication/repair protein RecF [Acidimicrobiia bacterium]|nr:DNA replication/repair protein RecF [Acidimicrobiia bacterium]